MYKKLSLIAILLLLTFIVFAEAPLSIDEYIDNGYIEDFSSIKGLKAYAENEDLGSAYELFCYENIDISSLDSDAGIEYLDSLISEEDQIVVVIMSLENNDVSLIIEYSYSTNLNDRILQIDKVHASIIEYDYREEIDEYPGSYDFIEICKLGIMIRKNDFF